jgi:hypothetical protein
MTFGWLPDQEPRSERRRRKREAKTSTESLQPQS